MSNSTKIVNLFLKNGWYADDETVNDAILMFLEGTDQLGRLSEWLKANSVANDTPFDMAEMQSACRIVAKIMCEIPSTGNGSYMAALQKFAQAGDDDNVWTDRTSLLQMQTMFLIQRSKSECRERFSDSEKPGFKANAMLRNYLSRS